jgi:hypothetical protein
MDNRWMLSGWFSRIISVGALLTFLMTEAVVIVASLGWPNAHVLLGTREICQLLVNAFLASLPFFVGIRGCSVVRRLQSKFEAGREEATFVWLWRQFMAGTVIANGAIIVIVLSLAESFHPR